MPNIFLNRLQAFYLPCYLNNFISYFLLTINSTQLWASKDAFSCGPINMKFSPHKIAQLAPQNRQIEQIALSRSCGRSLENNENWVLGDIIASTVL